MLLLIAMHLMFGYTGVHNDNDGETAFHPVVQGQPSSGFTDDDDEQII
jgi:hypothetical protein